MSNKLSRTEQIIAEKTVCILLVRGEGLDGQKIYAYLAIRADKLSAFMDAQKQGTFYPEDFGIVIESGDGEPPPEVQEKMTKEYGFNHDAMLDIEDAGGAHNLSSNISSIMVQAASDADKK